MLEHLISFVLVPEPQWVGITGAYVRDPLGRAYNRTKPYSPTRVDKHESNQRWANYLDNLKLRTIAGNFITPNFGWSR